MSSNPRIPYQMASDRPRLPPPVPGKPLIVHVVVNVEYWPFDQPPPRKLIPGPHGNARRKERGLPARSEEHTSELQSLMRISYAVFCLKNKKAHDNTQSRSTL